MNELISIIMPAYNSSPHIDDAIESILCQTYENWELFVIDDGSIDNTRQIAREYSEQDKRIQVLSLGQNMGPAHARNRGIGAAKGRYIAFLDSDDLWRPQKLSHQLSFMRGNKAALSFTSYQYIIKDNARCGKIVRAPKILGYAEILAKNYIGCLTAMYDTQQLGKEYMPHYKRHQDHALWLSIMRNGVKAYGLEEVLAYYRVRYKEKAAKKIQGIINKWQIYRNAEKLSRMDSSISMLKYIYYGVTRWAG